jgi:hypothetical protein
MYTLKNTSAFTLIELMIVIAMVIILVWASIFPYTYYMDRARVEKTIDAISQEWVIAHQKIRGWFLAPGTTSHAHIYVDIIKGGNSLIFSTSTGELASRKSYKTYTFDKHITILSMSGAFDPMLGSLVYHIAPPLAQSTFFTGAVDEWYLTGIILTLGYPGAIPGSGRARDILLRPYFD